jgi:site-specific DNA-methyltransferase (cytosine-N4-specific)
MEYINKIYFSDSRNMKELPDNSISLIITSPPYFNVKDYSLDGYQQKKHSDKKYGQIGDIINYNQYINELLVVWKECHRVLKPNGKLAINTPLMPMLKRELNTHYNRHIFDIDSDIKYSILKNISSLFLLDVYIWNRTNPSKRLMFGSYPFPGNYYAQNTSEFISIYVKDGKPNSIKKEIKDRSKLTKDEWVSFTKQIWDIPIPNKHDIAFGKHSAIMPEEIVRRCIKLFSFVEDIVLDPFAGSGTTLKVAKQENRNFVGYEISESYRDIINEKISSVL